MMIEKNSDIIKITNLSILVNKKMRGIVPVTDEKNNLGRLVLLFNKRLVPINMQ